MATVPTQIRIDADVKRDAALLFSELGLDMSTAVNMFLRQCVLRKGLPFSVAKPQFSAATLEAIGEAVRISKDESVPCYDNMADLKRVLEE